MSKEYDLSSKKILNESIGMPNKVRTTNQIDLEKMNSYQEQAHSSNSMNHEQQKRRATRSIQLNKYTLAFNDDQLDSEWIYTQITLKKTINLIAFVFLIFLNASVDVVLYKVHGFQYVMLVRGICCIICIVLIYNIYYKHKKKLAQYFKKKQKQFYFIEEKKSDQKPRLRFNSEIMEDLENHINDRHQEYPRSQSQVIKNEMTLQTEFDIEIKKILKNQRMQYFMWQITVIINQISHETMDPQESFETLKGEELHKFLRNQSFYYGFSLMLVMSSLLAGNLNHIYSGTTALIYIIAVTFYAAYHPYHQELLGDYLYCAIGGYLVFITLYYIDMKNSKKYFLSQLKNHRLIRDQIEIFNNLPDGLIIFQQIKNKIENGYRGQKIMDEEEIDIKYLNSAVSQMLFNYECATTNNNQFIYASGVNVINNEGTNQATANSDVWDKNTNFKNKLKSLKKIYLKKTCYKIVDQKNVECSVMPLEKPKNLIEHISNFENGQVYEIVFKTGYQQEFQTYSQMHRQRQSSAGSMALDNDNERKNYLVYILRQTAYINDEEQTLTYFKDITFGVLYEQIKAQEELKNLINTTLQQKISIPLQACVKSCKNLRDCRQLQIIEQHQFRNKNLRNQLSGIILQFKAVIFKLNDMQDWQSLINGRFMKKNISFDLQEKLVEIEYLMKSKAQIKQLKLLFETNFDTSQQIVQIVQYEQLLHSVLVSNQTIDDHPLLNYIPNIDKNQLLPRFMIGDPDRLQQVAINIIQNAIQYSYSGNIVVYVSFDQKESKLVFIVKDQGIGIKKEDQKTIFQLLSSVPKTYDKKYFRLSDGKQIGLGLFVSKQIVMNFGGQLDFISSQESGSTFIFTYDVEVDCNKELIENTAIQMNEVENEIEKDYDEIGDVSPNNLIYQNQLSPRFPSQEGRVEEEQRSFIASTARDNIPRDASNFTLNSQIEETIKQTYHSSGGTGD